MKDLTEWTDEALCREIAAQRTGGDYRISVDRWAYVQAEYDRRRGIVASSQDGVFGDLMSGLGRDAVTEAARYNLPRDIADLRARGFD